MPKFIVFEKLYCLNINNTDQDQIRLQIWVDKTRIPLSKMTFLVGQSFNLDTSFQFDNLVEVGLFDEDNREDENLLRLVRLQLNLFRQTLTIDLNSDKGSYTLFYRIELETTPELLPPPPLSPFPSGGDGGGTIIDEHTPMPG
jgi:hypothetical protein